MTIISTKELDIYLERSSPREHGQIFYIGGTGGDLRNRPNQLDSPLTEFFEVISYDQKLGCIILARDLVGWKKNK